MAPKTKFFEIKIFNDWGHFYYAPVKEGLTKNGSASQSLGLQFKDGQRILVKFPDGAQDTVTLSSKIHTDQVSDHGNSYDVSSKKFGFYVRINGLKVWTPIENVKLSEKDIMRLKPLDK